MIDPRPPLPVTLLGGFLGAGKTTLLNRLLQTLSGRRVAVVVNDFGELNIDAKLVTSVEAGVTELAGGCMCCAIRESAVSTVLQLAERDLPPEHVVIEASGASDVGVLAETFRTFERAQAVRLDALCTLVDAERFDPEDPELGSLLRAQVRDADLVVVNKTDLVSEARRAEVEAEVRALALHARLWSTSDAEVPPELLFGPAPVERVAEPAPPAADLFDSRVLGGDFAVVGTKLVDFFRGLPSSIYRAKGLARLAERPEDCVEVQVVGRRIHIRTRPEGWPEGVEPGTRLVVIGVRGRVDWDAVQEDLHDATG